MLRTFGIAVIAIAFAMSGSANVATAKSKGVRGDPPHASTAGLKSRAQVVNQYGANRRGFCPPGQAKKPGRGSAFRC
jgi:hypothetical protein